MIDATIETAEPVPETLLRPKREQATPFERRIGLGIAVGLGAAAYVFRSNPALLFSCAGGSYWVFMMNALAGYPWKKLSNAFYTVAGTAGVVALGKFMFLPMYPELMDKNYVGSDTAIRSFVETCPAAGTEKILQLSPIGSIDVKIGDVTYSKNLLTTVSSGKSDREKTVYSASYAASLTGREPAKDLWGTGYHLKPVRNDYTGPAVLTANNCVPSAARPR